MADDADSDAGADGGRVSVAVCSCDVGIVDAACWQAKYRRLSFISECDTAGRLLYKLRLLTGHPDNIRHTDIHSY
jgi:hypothetical protein